MRISERQIYDSGSLRLARQREVLAEKTEQASSGRRVTTAASDPVAAALLERNDATAGRASSIARSTGAADADLLAVDGALGSAASILEDTLSLAVQMANGTFTGVDRAGAALQAEQNLKAFVAALNIEQDGRFLLGGTNQSQPPFRSDGTYGGDDGARKLEVAPGLFEEVSVRADVGVAGQPSGINIPAAFLALRDALATNNEGDIRASIEVFHQSVAQLGNLRSDVGSKSVMLQSARSTSLAVYDAAQRSSAEAGDADIATTATELSLAERAFEAAAQATAHSFRQTLLNTLR